jgi:uncharacterized membrane protein
VDRVTDNKCKFLALALALAANISLISSAGIQPAEAKLDVSGIQVCEESLDKKPYQTSKILVKARPEQVWQVLTDYSGAPQVFTTLRKVQVVLDKGCTKIIHYEMKPTGVMATFQYDLEIREQPHRYVEWHRVGGDFKEVDGFWKLEPVEGGRSTVVTYGSHVNGGFLMPQPFIKRQARIDLPRALAALKEHAETTMRIATQSRGGRLINSN